MPGFSSTAWGLVLADLRPTWNLWACAAQICVNVARCRLHTTSCMIAPNSNLRATSMRWISLLFWNTLRNQSSDQHIFLFVYTKEEESDKQTFYPFNVITFHSWHYRLPARFAEAPRQFPNKLHSKSRRQVDGDCLRQKWFTMIAPATHVPVVRLAFLMPNSRIDLVNSVLAWENACTS